MLFRNVHGELININKTDFVNDKLYYKSIVELKKTLLNYNMLFKTKINSNPKKNINIYSPRIFTVN
jgi:hypothetical protein